MGWWKVQGTEKMVGDGPLDALGVAVAEVVKEYQAAFHRRPTVAEWEALLTCAFLSEAEPLDNRTVKSVTLGMEEDGKAQA